ncbi:MAG TPA: hypothetical protein VJ739_04385 [Gemmataceae bacterium]|nr:hypothetical protein [Gemmataceae bacterium]
MVRLVSLFGVAFLALAAVSLIGPPQRMTQEPEFEPDRNESPAAAPSRMSFEVVPSYHARFSLN